jgi:putative ABC transport system substrate-binding protein
MKRRRRTTIVALGAVLAAPLAAFAQQPGRILKLGILFVGTEASSENYFRAFFEALSAEGFAQGGNLEVVGRFANGRIDRLDALAAELVAARVDVIYAPPTPAALAARKSTTAIPIVFSMTPDPVATGLVRSLARAGGNATGLSTLGRELAAKRIELLRELLPTVRRIGLLYDTSREPGAAVSREAAVHAAKALGITVIDGDVHSAERIRPTIVTLKEKGAEAILVFEGSLALSNRELVMAQTAASRLPALYPYPEIPAEGGLISYSANIVDQYRRAATIVAKILRGAKPAELPVEQPVRLELIVNLQSAKALGIRVPHSIMLRADKAIE